MGVAQTEDRRLRVLELWRLLELLSTQQVPRKGRTETSQVVDWTSDKPLPWDTVRAVWRDGARLTWRHIVYLGVYAIDDTHEILRRTFGQDAESADERPLGRGACAGIVVGPDGRPIPGSATLSSALWTVWRLQERRDANEPAFDDFEEANAAFQEQAEAITGMAAAPADEDGAGSGAPDGGAARLDGETLRRLLTAAHKAAGVRGRPALCTPQVCIRSVAVSARRAAGPVGTEFLNSFFLDDLHRIRDRARAGDVGEALGRYLMPDDELDPDIRIDVARRRAAVEEGVRVERLPLGRWPAEADRPATLSRQFAINHALTDLAPEAGLMGVLHPPGTGKKELLRDVLAGNVVARARRLAELERARDAFVGEPLQWRTDSFSRELPRLRPELTGFEMVVASARDGATAGGEGIAAALPERTALAPKWREQADYFARLASTVLTETQRAESPVDAWGLVSARLGRLSRRSAFRASLWFGDGDDDAADDDPSVRMFAQLKAWRSGASPYRPWHEARARFLDAVHRVEALIDQRREAQARLIRLAALERAKPSSERAVPEAREKVERASRAVDEQLAAQAEAEVRRNRAALAEAEHIAAKPGIFAVIRSRGRASRRWRLDHLPLSRSLRTAEAEFRQASVTTERLRTTLARRKADLVDVEQMLTRTEAEIDRLTAARDAEADRLGEAHPARLAPERRETRAPWLDLELEEARSELFLAAMDLHHDFIANNTGIMLTALNAALEVVGGNAPKDLDPEAVRAAWQLFFLLVPLVSTTLASASRMLRGVGREGIGWLVVDEAGQAAPQCAVGAMWHAKRVIAVGDPLQLQPAVTLPERARQALAEAYGVDQEWLAPAASVQTLVDRASDVGTSLPRDGGRMWVGIPLRVHRRCDDPMFSLCNDLAYNGLMVSQVRREASDAEDPFGLDASGRPRIRPSAWADEKATEAGTHLQSNQIARLDKALAYLTRRGVAPEQIIAVSPFRQVAQHLELMSHRTRYHGMRAGDIRAVQDDQADVVLLVLGGDPHLEEATARAAASLNLVNVAASRARRRLYVIGDRDAWACYPYFRKLAEALAVM
ncbi:AAA domain-containing protein [uncultured Actinomyces sp.]|uniref:DEAD/DEAH box helicase n=1 Tax=uncultured Actinomyces sp. TaxID=249061 RepID=UPI00288ACF0C|nr:AAA domain-containing protein [uncultured Actinomyces sp.]